MQPSQQDDAFYMQKARDLKAKREAAAKEAERDAAASGAGSAHPVAEVDEDQLSVGSVDFDTEVTLLQEMDGW